MERFLSHLFCPLLPHLSPNKSKDPKLSPQGLERHHCPSQVPWLSAPGSVLTLQEPGHGSGGDVEDVLNEAGPQPNKTDQRAVANSHHWNKIDCPERTHPPHWCIGCPERTHPPHWCSGLPREDSPSTLVRPSSARRELTHHLGAVLWFPRLIAAGWSCPPSHRS